MIKETLNALLVGATILGRTVVFNNEVEYNEYNLVKTTEATDVYRTNKQTSYGNLLTWQLVDVQLYNETETTKQYTYTSNLLYKIDNINLSSIQIEKRWRFNNTVSNQTVNFKCWITQLTSYALEQINIEEYVNYTPQEILQNKEVIQNDLDVLANQNTTQYSKPLYYVSRDIRAATTMASNIDTTSNNPTTERTMYIYAQIEAVYTCNASETFNYNYAKNTRIANLNSIGTATIDNKDVEVIDLPGLLFTILTMPFSFISTAFNLTIFPGTPYQLNISNLVMTLIASLLLIFIIKKFTK